MCVMIISVSHYLCLVDFVVSSLEQKHARLTDLAKFHSEVGQLVGPLAIWRKNLSYIVLNS